VQLSCPQDVDIRALNRKFDEDVQEVFNTNPASEKRLTRLLITIAQRIFKPSW